MSAAPALILGSASPRRRDLLAQIGLTPAAIRPADIDETPHPRETPRAYVLRMAREKALAMTLSPDEVGLTADTTVVAGRRILGKPADEAEARAFLTLLSGRRHQVLTAVATRRGADLRARLVVTAVRLARLTPAAITRYLATGDWRGKAGGYALQGPAAAFIPWIAGSPSAVIGLPLAETAALLDAAGVRP